MSQTEARGEGESARDEALRLLVKACGIPVHKVMDFETGHYPLSIDQVERLIALARQRPGRVWVPKDTKEWAERIERQCDNFATGTQDRQFLRDDEDNEPLYRELLRLNFEQFVRLYFAAAPKQGDI